MKSSTPPELLGWGPRPGVERSGNPRIVGVRGEKPAKAGDSRFVARITTFGLSRAPRAWLLSVCKPGVSLRSTQALCWCPRRGLVFDPGRIHMFRQSVFSLIALVTLISTQAYSQSPAGLMPGVDPAFFNGLHYRLVGPSRGGGVTTVTGVPSQPKTFYRGVATGGLFRTMDRAPSWSPITDGQGPLGSPRCVSIA